MADPEPSPSHRSTDGDRPLSAAAQSSAADWELLISETSLKEPNATELKPPLTAASPDERPAQIDRYRVEAILGSGAFGTVYRCYDDVLKRCVAVKVPHPHLLNSPELYLQEARVLASLEHPAIVPVHDAGRTEDGMCYVVSKFIEGSDLKTRNQQAPLSHREAVELVATMAEALHYAHLHRVVHRDLKPANILIDSQLRPYLADFGLALREEDLSQQGRWAGTPVYMSPEQARGEGHLVDGRSDIFSLGVVLYELLTAKRPFRGSNTTEVLERIRMLEPRPPRQFDDTIPKELERVCLKALSKRASDRYNTALDMAEDLRVFLAEFHETARPPLSAPPAAVAALPAQTTGTPAISTVGVDSERPVKIVPKGLRSFDQSDADFFLKLLPGPHDRHGLPESIRFWKIRIEESDPENSFRVGLIYGPSGCGKSSLVKAGLLPRLDSSVVKVYVEASGGETEDRLLRNLRRQLPGLGDLPGLVEVLAALRRGQGLAAGDKVLLVIDQFEQWLHAHGGENDAELISALRQCDGNRVQCLVLVRDDFWLAVSRFMHALEVRVVEGENSRLVDLFDARHARKVLAALGCAFGAIPESNRSKEQDSFLDQAVASLGQDGKVVSVRLALFAEMVKGKKWTPATLREIGGAEGVGVAFLEETFSSPTAPPHHRLHQKTAQAVLAALLPEAGSDIKGHMRGREELLRAASCTNQPQQFDEVIALLDRELRLVTPSDSEGLEVDASAPAVARNKRYQLTHDYLVPSLRTWLTRKQRETRKGRAELRLAERSASWNAKPENRHLPSLWEFLTIRWLTDRKNWAGPERKMMGQAGWVHGIRTAFVTAMVVVAAFAVMGIRNAVVEKHNATRAEGLVDALVKAEITQVPASVIELEKYRTWANPLLKAKFDQAKDRSSQRLNMALALLPVDAAQVEYLYKRLLTARPNEVRVIREALAPHKGKLIDRLWGVVERPDKGQGQARLPAAAALADYEPESQRWSKAGSTIAEDMVSANPVALGLWTEEFRPVKTRLLEPLSAVFRQQQSERATECSLATNLLADYAADQPQVLANLLMDADKTQFTIIFAALNKRGEEALPLFQSEVDKAPSPDATEEAKEGLAKRKANAAVALLKMKQPAKAWPLLQWHPDPRARTHVIHRLAPLQADVTAIVRRLDEETDISAQRALILCLGEFDVTQFLPAPRQALIAKLLDLYRNDPDPGLHAAVRWLLRERGWEQGRRVSEVDESLRVDEKQRQARKATDKRQWYVNTEMQTFVIVDARQPFTMGSPPGEREREDKESQHARLVGRRYAIAANTVTKKQFWRFLSEQPLDKVADMPAGSIDRSDDSPQTGMTWYEAAKYCNWLSAKEGISRDQWCYEPNEQGEYAEGMRAKDNYLTLTGYRLPTEAEWEFACRAGAVTRFYFGQDEALLGSYARYHANSEEHTWPVASLKPNDFGLFDMLGNVFQWCEWPAKRYPKPGLAVADDSQAGRKVTDSLPSAVRGGAYWNMPGHVRAAYRGLGNPYDRQKYFGLRPVRTISCY